jgi:hypothetical protein
VTFQNMPLREIPYIQDLHFGALIALHRSGERGNRLRHAHTGIQPGIDGARGEAMCSVDTRLNGSLWA